MNHPRPDRIVECPHGAVCGACSFLGRPYPSQLEAKRRRLTEILEEKVRCGPNQILKTMPSPLSRGYRNRAKMTISTGHDRRSKLGYFQRRSREVVDAPQCAVLVPALLETTLRLRELLNGPANIPFSLRHIDLRCGTDPERQHLTLVVRSATMPPLPIEAITEQCHFVTGIGIHLNPGSGPQVIKGRIEPCWGEREVFVDVAELTLRVSPGSFFQVNLGLVPKIHSRMAEFLGDGDLLLDLYAGVGTHGLALRRHFRRVLCIEGVRSSVADARASIAAGQVRNVEIIANPIRRALRRLRSERPDAVILNPSAAGAETDVLEVVTASSAKSVAYLSCDPVTLARDLPHLINGGFELVSAQVVDMMPQTRQVETLALLRR